MSSPYVGGSENWEEYGAFCQSEIPTAVNMDITFFLSSYRSTRRHITGELDIHNIIPVICGLNCRSYTTI
jgi:hypothetical protein